MDSKFSQTPSRGERFKELAFSALRAFGYGCLTAAGMSAVIFAFAYFTSGMNMFTGIDWVRRVMYVISSLGIIACGVGLLFSGKEYEDRQMGFTRDIDDPISLKEGKLDPRISKIETNHLSWQAAILYASIGMFVVTTIFDEVMSHTFLM